MWLGWFSGEDKRNCFWLRAQSCPHAVKASSGVSGLDDPVFWAREPIFKLEIIPQDNSCVLFHLWDLGFLGGCVIACGVRAYVHAYVRACVHACLRAYVHSVMLSFIRVLLREALLPRALPLVPCRLLSHSW